MIPPRPIGLWPSAATLPANLLRVHVTFDRPARDLVSADDLTLADDQGRAVTGAFMDFGRELWDRSGTQLTVLFDPGRVKRSVAGDESSAAVLVEGSTYELRIGEHLHHFCVGPACRSPITVQDWTVREPTDLGEELTVTFDRLMDHPSASHRLEVWDHQNEKVTGSCDMADGGRSWAFRPDQPWTPGKYLLVASAQLEDVCGNRIGEALDHDAGDHNDPHSAGLAFDVARRQRAGGGC